MGSKAVVGGWEARHGGSGIIAVTSENFAVQSCSLQMLFCWHCIG
jgi:hypothetical protein